MAVEVFVYKMSDHMETAQILKWLVREGERVERGQVILELMTDKVTAELEAPEAGIIKGIRPGAVDDAIVPIGEALCYIAAPGETVPALPPLPGYVPAEPPLEDRAAAVAAAAAAPEPDAEGAGPRASPVARKVARELGVDLNKVSGSGPLGRITESDVRAFAAASVASPPAPAAPAIPSPAPLAPSPATLAPSPATLAPSPGGAVPPTTPAAMPKPAPAPSQPGVAETPLTAIQRVTGERLRESIVNAPQFAIDVMADMTQALWLRDQLDERITAEAGTGLSITALLVKVAAASLKRHPRANAEFAGDRLRLHGEINVAVAIGTDDGLVAPVIRNADSKPLAEITRDLARFREQAKTLRFSAEDLTGGTFTISNLGMFGIDGFRAIVNPPQSAILATGRIQELPAGLPDGSIGLRPRMSLTLTVDHRCLDGLQAARFLTEIKDLLERPHLLLA